DNVYLRVKYRNPVAIAKADGTSVVLTPVNNKAWSGDSQIAAGDFLLLGLDSKGFYRNSLVLEGTATAAYCQKLAYDNGCIYAQGYITGDGSDMKAGAFTISPTTVMSPLFLCTDTDFNTKWAKCYRGEQVQNKLGLQNIGITVSNGYMWICGQYNLKMTDPDNSANIITATQGSIREGFILKLDAATGRWAAARNSRDDEWNHPSALAKTGLTGYLKILHNPATPDVVYAFGYVMNMNVGVFLREYNANTLEANLSDGQNNVVTGGGAPSCQSVAYDTQNNCVYLTARGNKAFSTVGGITSATPAGWGVLIAKFTMPADNTSSIGAIESDIDNDTLPVEYYNLQG
ncbi:MAG: hypothetical protein K2M76_00760, partial [Muribaculaceae bacterium]|nr:hypothetical protein [Muribaculaceae bacterium]